MNKSALLPSTVFLALMGAANSSLGQVDIVGSLRCSEVDARYRTGSVSEIAFERPLLFRAVTDGRAETSVSSPFPGDPSKTNHQWWKINVLPSYEVFLSGTGRRDGAPVWGYELKAKAAGANSTEVELSGSMLGSKGPFDTIRSCTYKFFVHGGTLADAMIPAAEAVFERRRRQLAAEAETTRIAEEQARLAQERIAELAKKQQDVEIERAQIAAEKERLAEQARKIEAEKSAAAEAVRKIEEERKKVAEQQAKATALQAKFAADQARQRKTDLDRQDAERKRDAEQVRLATNQQVLQSQQAVSAAEQARMAESQQAMQRQQAMTEKRVGNVEVVLGNIVLPRGERSNDWILRSPSIPVQQQQFCRVIDKFYDDLAAVYKTRNEIKKNAVYRDRQQDVAALLPNGSFDNWLVRLVEVTQAKDGSAAVMLQLPCRAMSGSDTCAKDPSKPQAAIGVNSVAFRELQRTDTGSFVVISGRLLFAAMDTSQKALPSYATYEPGSHCTATEGGKQQEVFTSEVRYLFQLR